MTNLIISHPVAVLSEYHLIRDGESYFIFHRVNGSCKRRCRVESAEAYELYGRLRHERTIGESYRNSQAVGCFEPGEGIKWALTAWVMESESCGTSAG